MGATHHRSITITDHPGQTEYIRQVAEKLPPLISPARLAKLFDMDRRRIYEMVQTAQLAAVRHGKRGMRVFRQSVIDWLERGGS